MIEYGICELQREEEFEGWFCHFQHPDLATVLRKWSKYSKSHDLLDGNWQITQYKKVDGHWLAMIDFVATDIYFYKEE